MLQLLMRPRGTRQTAPRPLFSLITDAIRSVVAPAALVREQAPATAPDPTDVYAADDMPADEVVEAAAVEFVHSADQARRADRGKRAARKVLDRLPAGRYGNWLVSRTPSSRQTADLDTIRATYKRLGLGPVPMKAAAPSVKVERIPSAGGDDLPWMPPIPQPQPEPAPRVLETGRLYELLPHPTLQNTIDGIVTVSVVGPIGTQVWVTVTGLVAVPAEDDEPAAVIESTWIVKPERIGQPIPASELVTA